MLVAQGNTFLLGPVHLPTLHMARTEFAPATSPCRTLDELAAQAGHVSAATMLASWENQRVAVRTICVILVSLRMSPMNIAPALLASAIWTLAPECRGFATFAVGHVLMAK